MSRPARERAADAVVGCRVVLLVGSGNNGGDALWAGAFLAGRGCRVDAVTLRRSLACRGRGRAASGRAVACIAGDAERCRRAH